MNMGLSVRASGIALEAFAGTGARWIKYQGSIIRHQREHKPSSSSIQELCVYCSCFLPLIPCCSQPKFPI